MNALARVVAGGICLLSANLGAQTVYFQDFEVNDTANWTVNDPGLSDTTADFFFDYSTVGIPASPVGGTRGLKLSANNFGGVFSGLSVSPTGLSLPSSYSLNFNWWANSVGPFPGGGSGSTQLSTFGVETSGLVPQWPGAFQESVWFGATGDGNSFSDYRAYSPSQPISYAEGSSVYFASSRNDSDPYYSLLGGNAPPIAQANLYASQTGNVAVGAPAFAWRQVRIVKTPDFATWIVDGLPLARVPIAGEFLGGANLFFGHSDTNSSISSDPNAAALLFTLIDNVFVEAAPAAVPINYAGDLIPGVTASGSVSEMGTSNDPRLAQYWSFSGNQGDIITLEALRAELDLDPAMWLFSGTFTDTAAFDAGLGAGFDTLDPGYLAFADDEIPNPGPFGDPRIMSLALPATGVYTVAITNFASDPDDGGDGFFDYRITLQPIPEPSTLLLVGITIGLLTIRRRK